MRESIKFNEDEIPDEGYKTSFVVKLTTELTDYKNNIKGD